ncbi:glycosyltransferase family 4 protein [Helicobacter sp. 11S02596-1]|uniref:glycosyltransferase n=1 Tax=Helicobacter sp. 11S02596-1 TaxID=1476194 RepID=UPI000BD1CACF|nr:glycosyltransferase family 4 protein [Helicobacter sp. 11S02596-1]PAF44788.1 hypothetical protein BJI48_02025 [Helicobacter sp. 11S02596-1]
MLKILVLCAANPATNPRPKRMIDLLKANHQVCAMGICASSIEGVETFSYPAYTKRNLLEEIHLYIHSFSKNYAPLIWTKNRLEITKLLQKRAFDLIICHDLVLLPIVLADKKGAKVLFDAREFYPAQNQTNFRWRLLFAKFNDYLCKTYLLQADSVITVSKGLQTLYKKHYGISSKLFYSLPKYHDLPPSPIKPSTIKIIHHGAANPNRKIEKMIEVANFLDGRFELDLMLVNTDTSYMEFLQKKVAKMRHKGKKVAIIPPVAYEEIIPFSACYDMGLYCIPPSTPNLKHALPNKFFEFIQARLAIIITPNPEMSPFIATYKNGFIVDDFRPKQIAHAINALSVEQIQAYKQNSAQAAKILNTQSNQANIDAIIKELFPER